MTSSNGNIFPVTGLCAGNSPVPVNSPNKGQWRGASMVSLICVWINGWINNREAADLRRHRGHYDVNVMWTLILRIVRTEMSALAIALEVWQQHVSRITGRVNEKCQRHTVHLSDKEIIKFGESIEWVEFLFHVPKMLYTQLDLAHMSPTD